MRVPPDRQSPNRHGGHPLGACGAYTLCWSSLTDPPETIAPQPCKVAVTDDNMVHTEDDFLTYLVVEDYLEAFAAFEPLRPLSFLTRAAASFLLNEYRPSSSSLLKSSRPSSDRR